MARHGANCAPPCRLDRLRARLAGVAGTTSVQVSVRVALKTQLHNDSLECDKKTLGPSVNAAVLKIP